MPTNKTLEKLVQAFIYLTFFVPLVVIPTSFIFPFIVPKILLMRSLVALMAAGYLLLFFSNKAAYRPRLTWLTGALLFFFASFFISTFVGVDAYHSFWDNHERMLGLFTIAHYIIYYFVANAVFKTWTDWQRALWLFLGAGSIVMFIGLLQVGNPDLLLNQGNQRVASTLGNPIYVGRYGLFLTFVAALLVFKERNIVWRLLAGALGFLALLGMFYSGTRGSMLGFAAGILVALFVGGLIAKDKRLRIATWVGVAVFCLAVAGLYQNRDNEFVQRIPAIGRVVGTSLEDVKQSPRWIAWTIAWQSFKERPLFGWGPNNFFYAFNQHYSPRSLEFGYGETWFDNAHNIIMNTFAVQGIVGIVSYLAITLAAVLTLLVAYRKKGISAPLAVLGTAFLIGHLVENVTVFEDPTSYVYFMFWLAMVNQNTAFGIRRKETDANKLQPEVNTPSKKIGEAALGGAVIGVFVWIFIFNIQPARANMKTLNAMRAVQSDPSTALPIVKSTFAFSSPHIDDIRNDLSRSIISILGPTYQKFGSKIGDEYVAITKEALQQNLKLHPRDIRVGLTYVQLLQIEAMAKNSREPIIEAETLLTDLMQYSKKRQQMVYQLAWLKLQLGKVGEGATLLQDVLNDNPKISESYWRLAYAFKVNGEPDKVAAVFDLAKRNGIVWTNEELSIISQIIGPSTTTTKK